MIFSLFLCESSSRIGKQRTNRILARAHASHTCQRALGFQSGELAITKKGSAKCFMRRAKSFPRIEIGYDEYATLKRGRMIEAMDSVMGFGLH